MSNTFTFYDTDDNTAHKIKVSVNFGGGYNIRVDGQFWSTHESRAEADEEIKDIMNLYCWSFVPSL